MNYSATDELFCDRRMNYSATDELIILRQTNLAIYGCGRFALLGSWVHVSLSSQGGGRTGVGTPKNPGLGGHL
jgi:hypothetical protein